MTFHDAAPTDSETFRFLARLHEHRRPMSILGARLDQAARDALGAADGVGLTALFLQRNSALDGVQVATGDTADNRSLEVGPREEATGRRVAVVPTKVALARSREYVGLRERVGTLPPGDPGRAGALRRMEEILAELEEAPAAQVVRVEAAPPAGTPGAP